MPQQFDADIQPGSRPVFVAQFGSTTVTSSFTPFPGNSGSFLEKKDLFTPAPGQVAFVLTAQVTSGAIIKPYVNGELAMEDFSISGSGTVTITFIATGYSLSTTDLITVLYS